MKASLLNIPAKKTAEVDWTTPLNKYLQAVYGSSSDFQEDVTRLKALRHAMRVARADDAGMVALMRYFSYLELVDLRVPMDAVNRVKMLVFTWYDAFDSAPYQQRALAFEKAAVLFNLGSAMSRAAHTCYTASLRGSDDGAFKRALLLMQHAAGVYAYVAENFLHAPSADLAPKTVELLSQMCLAQSQEMFTLRAIDGDMAQTKNALIARLCEATAQQYANCYDCVEPVGSSAYSLSAGDNSDNTSEDDADDDIYDVFDPEDPVEPASPAYMNHAQLDSMPRSKKKVAARLDPLWPAAFQVKTTYYKSLACYFQGLHVEAAGRYGEAIAYFTRAAESLASVAPESLRALSKAGEALYDLLDSCKCQKDAVDIKLADVNKDNDMVYHELVPRFVPDLKPMVSVKLVAIAHMPEFADINDDSYASFLRNVVPVDVHELMSYYSEQKSQFFRAELEENDIASEKLASALEALQLPRALVAIKDLFTGDNSTQNGTYSALPADALAQVDEIAAAHAADAERRTNMARKRDLVYLLMHRSQQRLDAAQFAPEFTRLQQDLIRLKKSLYDASSSDARLFGLVDAHETLYRALGAGTDSDLFRSMFSMPQPSSAACEVSLLDMDDRNPGTRHGGVLAQISALEDMLNELHVLSRERQQLVNSLEDDIHKDDIADIIMLNSKAKSASEIRRDIFPDELKKFDAYLRKLDTLMAQQDQRVSKLQRAWHALVKMPKVRDAQALYRTRSSVADEHVGRIGLFYDSWEKYSAGLRHGADFYDQLFVFAQGLSSAIDAAAEGTLVSDSFGSLLLTSGALGAPQPLPGPMEQPRQPLRQPLEHSVQPLGHSVQPLEHSVQPLVHSLGQLLGQQTNPLRPGRYTTSTGQPQAQTGNSQALIYDQPSAYQPHMYNLFLKDP